MKTEIILKEGYPFIGATFSIFFFSLLMTDDFLWQFFWFATFAFFVYFFRNPERVPEDSSEGAIISPSDGEVIEIVNTISPLTNRESIKISIRLSIFDVHVQRAPIAGEIKAREYIHGMFLKLSSEKASELNEQNRVLFENENTQIEVNQIAGFLTRRIVMFRDLGKIDLAERYGMIIFGSQVDIYLPLETKIKVTEFQKIKAGETLLGYLNEN